MNIIPGEKRQGFGHAYDPERMKEVSGGLPSREELRQEGEKESLDLCRSGDNIGVSYSCDAYSF